MTYIDTNYIKKLSNTNCDTSTPLSKNIVSKNVQMAHSLQSFEDELVELDDISELDLNKTGASTISVEDIQKEIDSKLQEIEDLQKDTLDFIDECKSEITNIISNGTNVIPNEVQLRYNLRLSSITNETLNNTAIMQEEQGIIDENKKLIEDSEYEIEKDKKEITELENEIKKLEKKGDKKSLSKIKELNGKINNLECDIQGLEATIKMSNNAISLANETYEKAAKDNSALIDEQGSLMTNLLNDYYKTHTEEDRVLEDEVLASKISSLESYIKQSSLNLIANTMKLSNQVQLLCIQKNQKQQEMMQMASVQKSAQTAVKSYPINNSYQGNLPANNELAQIAQNTGARRNTTGWCLAGVNDSLEKAYGFRLSYNSAYQAIPALQQRGDFTEVTGQYASPQSLRNLPAGAIVVWENSSSHPHGHISIALGNGQEASDHIQNQTVNYGTQYHVFIKNS